MTPEKINLIRQNFALVTPQSESVATVFYNRLFAANPPLRLLFPKDLTAQKTKLMSGLELAVENLDDPAALFPVLKDLGRRHALYGVRREHYGAVGAALLQTLRDALGKEFSAEANSAWAEMYETIAAIMKSGAAELAALEWESDIHLQDTKRMPKPAAGQPG